MFGKTSLENPSCEDTGGRGARFIIEDNLKRNGGETKQKKTKRREKVTGHGSVKEKSNARKQRRRTGKPSLARKEHVIE